MSDLSQLSNIQLELELVREEKFQKNFEQVFYKLQAICEEECDLSVEDLLEHLKLSSLKVAVYKQELKSRINDAGLSAFEASLGQAE